MDFCKMFERLCHVVFFCLAPPLFIWSANLLFETQIEYNFWNFVAVFVIILISRLTVEVNLNAGLDLDKNESVVVKNDNIL